MLSRRNTRAVAKPSTTMPYMGEGRVVLPKDFSLEVGRREAAYNRLIPFCEYMLPKFDPRPHKELIAGAFELVENGTIPYLLIFAPPRHWKSLIGKYFLAWMLGRNPDRRVMLCAYGDDLAELHSVDARNLLKDPAYQRVFPGVELDPKSTSAALWRLRSPHRGGMRAAGVGTGITGFSANCLPAGTMVQTEAGAVDIAELVAMETRPRVLAYDHDTTEAVWRKVVAAKGNYTNYLTKVSTQDGKSLLCTPDHQIYTFEEGYIPAHRVSPENFGRVVYNSRRIEAMPFNPVWNSYVPNTPVYDIQVEGTSNFFANGILVHNCILIDDPIKNKEQADSPADRESKIEWFQTSVMSRMEPETAIVIIQTLWSPHDMANWLLERQAEGGLPWHVLRLPAVAETPEQTAEWAEKHHIPPSRFLTSDKALRRAKRDYREREEGASIGE